MFIRLSPAQSTGIYGWWNARLKTTLTWKDIEEMEHINLELLIKWQVSPRELFKLQPDISKWVLHAGAKAQHAKELVQWCAHPMKDLHGDLADILAMQATSKQLKAMGVTYRDMKDAGMTPETMRLMGLPLQGWMDLHLTMTDIQRDFTDAQLGKVFGMTRVAVAACFK